MDSGYKVLYISRFEMERYRSIECVPSTKGVQHTARGWECGTYDQTLQ